MHQRLDTLLAHLVSNVDTYSYLGWRMLQYKSSEPLAQTWNHFWLQIISLMPIRECHLRKWWQKQCQWLWRKLFTLLPHWPFLCMLPLVCSGSPWTLSSILATSSPRWNSSSPMSRRIWPHLLSVPHSARSVFLSSVYLYTNVLKGHIKVLFRSTSNFFRPMTLTRPEFCTIPVLRIVKRTILGKVVKIGYIYLWATVLGQKEYSHLWLIRRSNIVINALSLPWFRKKLIWWLLLVQKHHRTAPASLDFLKRFATGLFGVVKGRDQIQNEQYEYKLREVSV